MQQAYILSARDIEKAFMNVKALDKVSFDVAAGEIHALVGENGAGKSTLIKILAGVYRKDAGEILMDGRPVSIRHPHDAKECGLSFIHQELFQIKDFTVAENMFYGRKYPKNRFGLIDWKEVNKTAERQIDVFSDRKDLSTMLISQTSMANRYLTAIGKSLAEKSKVLFLDEPTASLTYDETEKLFAILNRLKASNISIVYISHRLGEIFRICDRVTVLRDGKVVSKKLIRDCTVDDVIYDMLGESIDQKFPKRRIKAGAICLEARNLSSQKMPQCSFHVKRGEIVGFIGLIGSGRTELARLIFGLDRRLQGTLSVNGKEVHFRNNRQAIRSGICLVPEDRQIQGLILNMTICANATLANLGKYCLTLFKLMRFPQMTASVGRYVQRLRIKCDRVGEKVGFLSGGNQQKVCIAKWIDADGRVFIFDEPTKGIDVGAKTEVYEVMQSLAEKDAGVVLMSSEIEEILGITDRFYVMFKGQIVCECDTRTVKYDDVVRLIQFGKTANLRNGAHPKERQSGNGGAL